TSCVSSAERDPEKELKLIKSYALSQCIARAFPHTEITSDARASAGGYMEHGGLPVEAYEAVVALVDEKLRTTYRGKHGEALHTMKCVDLGYSAELEAVARKSIADFH